MNNSFDWNEYIRSDYVRRKSGETFSEVLLRYLDDVHRNYGIRQQDICRISGISSTLMTKYKMGKRKPLLYSIITICLAMRLTYDRSEYLLYTAGYKLNDSTEHRIYKLFLNGCAFNEEYTLENCKAILLENGFDVD